MAGHEVRVKVSEKDVADPEAKFLGVGEILLDIALGVDDDGGRAGLVSEQIRSVGQAAQVVLFKNHSHLTAPGGTRLLGFGDHAEVRFQRLPAAGIFLLRFFVRHGGNDDYVLALLPIHRRRHLVFGGELHRIQDPKNFIEVPPRGHRVREHQFDLLVRTDDEDVRTVALLAAVRPSEVSPASAGSML